MSTFDALLVESPLVQAEMRRLRELHGVYEKALTLAVRDAAPELKEPYVRRRVERLIARATVEIHRARRASI